MHAKVSRICTQERPRRKAQRCQVNQHRDQARKSVKFDTEIEDLHCNTNQCEVASTKKEITPPAGLSGWQETLFVGLGIRDLVDHNSDTTLGDDVGAAVANLNADDRMCSIDAKHGEQVHDRTH